MVGSIDRPVYEDAVARIVSAALTLDERIAAQVKPSEPWDENRCESVLSAWKKACTDGNDDAFCERLGWSGLTAQTAGNFLGDLPPTQRASWPEWAETLHAAMEQFYGDGATADHGEAAGDVPFGDILEGFVQYARMRLAPTNEALRTFISDGGAEAFDAALRARLSDVAGQVLMAEFQTFRAPHLAGVMALPTSRLAYDKFVASMRASGMVALLQNYPVLGRLLGTVLRQWIDFVTEFADRLLSDWPILTKAFDLTEGERLTAFQLGVSDPHNGGRECIKLEFEDGRGLFYKPKQLRPDLAFQTLLERLTSIAGEPPALFPLTIDRGEYGWVEEVKWQACKNSSEVEDYYRSAGRVLFLQYLAGGSDIHHENLIACGPHPVVTDHECLMTNFPGSRKASGTAEYRALAEYAFNSVMRIAMLPEWTDVSAGEPIDLSALGATTGRMSAFASLEFRHPNSDVMRLHRVLPPERGIGANAVVLGGKAVDPGEHVGEIRKGFEDAYGLFLKHPSFANAFREELCELRARIVFRRTGVYADQMIRLKAPSNLRSGVAAQIALESLYRGILLDTHGGRQLRSLVASEITQMMRLDIPMLHADAGETSIVLPDGGIVADVFLKSACEELEQRIEGMGDTDLQQQSAYIATSFACRAHQEHDRSETAGSPAGALEEPVPSSRKLQEQAFLASKKIADDILAHAVRGDDGSLAWISVVYKKQLGAWRMTPMRQRLYDGSIGTAFFLAGLARQGGGANYETAAIGALSAFLDPDRRRETVRILKHPGLGGGTGVGSAIYGLVRIGEMLDRPDLLAAAQSVLEQVGPQEIAAAPDFSMLRGVAGFLNACLVLHEACSDGGAREAALRCVDHLMRHATRGPEGELFWSDEAGNRSSGFAEGISGIAVALFRAGQALRRPDLEQTAREAMASACSGRGSGNGLDERVSSSSIAGTSNSWFQGAIGQSLALMELSSKGAYPADDMSQALLMNLAELRDHPGMALDHLSYGGLGRASLLWRAGERFASRDLQESAEATIHGVVERAQSGTLELGWPAGFYVPSLHEGTAGIGYELLRYSGDSVLPDILTFE